MPPIDHAQIRDLLAQSRAAHVRYQAACPHAENHGGVITITAPDLTAQSQAIRDAHAARTQAHALDPTHTSPSWRGEPPNYRHDELMAFYADRLNAS